MLADDSRFNFEATTEPEFDRGRWVDYWAPVREVIYFKRAVYVRALQELGEQAFAEGPPPRPDWLTDAMLRAPQPRSPRRRRRTDSGPQPAANDEAMTDASVAASAPEGSEP
jgi:putative (di)nucleoside polyphosphate hydrolase